MAELMMELEAEALATVSGFIGGTAEQPPAHSEIRRFLIKVETELNRLAERLVREGSVAAAVPIATGGPNPLKIAYCLEVANDR